MFMKKVTLIYSLPLLILIGVLLYLTLISKYKLDMLNVDNTTEIRISSLETQTFRILWYKKHEYFPTRADLSKCPYSNCVLTDDKSLLETSDAVLFGYDPRNTNKPRKIPGQIWVIVHVESPANNRKLKRIWDNDLDWSMTYRRDGEILLNYIVYKRKDVLIKDYHAIFRKKTKNVAWAVSNCFTKSKRERYIRELKKYINIDIYGNCGDKGRCPGKMPECHVDLSQNYKFYIAFENSLCKDYITEKMFHTYLDNSNAIYVYRGAPNVKSVLPPKTYIDSRDFESPKELAIFLHKLGSNETEYISYLKEIDKYRIDEELNYYRALCSLCEQLNLKRSRKKPPSARHFNKWYRENVCVAPNDV